MVFQRIICPEWGTVSAEYPNTSSLADLGVTTNESSNARLIANEKQIRVKVFSLIHARNAPLKKRNIFTQSSSKEALNFKPYNSRTFLNKIKPQPIDK